MARPAEELFLRDGIYYARFSGHRWSTETVNKAEATRRLEFMKAKNKPWVEIKNDFGSYVTIKIDTSGNTVYSAFTQPTLDPGMAMQMLNSSPIPSRSTDEPPKECKDINILLDYEYRLRSNKPQAMVDFYERIYKHLRRYVNNNKLTLDTFTPERAMQYPKIRLSEGIGELGKIGYHNKSVSYKTVNKEVSHFKELFGTWRDENRVLINPWTRVEPLRATGDEKELDAEPYTIPEIKNIFDNVENEDILNALIFQIILGCRPGKEMLSITRETMDKNKIYNFKKRRWDDFTFSIEVKKFFTAHIEGRSLTDKTIRDGFQSACVKAKIRVGKPYDLRHTFGTEALKDNKLEIVQKFMRHGEAKTTQRYAKVRQTETAEAQQKMQRKILKQVS